MGNYTRWYRVGNVKLVQESRTIEGTDTYWLTAGLNPGDLFTVDGAQFYEVESITDNSHLTLKNTYAGVSVNDSPYSIIRNFTATMPADIAARTAELLGDFRKYIDTDMRSIHGESAYELAVQNGYVGTVTQWLESLKSDGEFVAMRDALASFEASADGRLSSLESGQGTLSTLSTAAKSSLVSAVNEVASNAGTLSNLSTASRVSLVSAINELVGHQGELNSLSTSAKGSLVAAINEVLSNEGALSSLTTSAKTTLVAAINELQYRTSVIAEARALGNAGFAHNLIYRGKCLGDKPTAEQWAAIKNGTFDDMYLGDYWTGVGESGWTDLYWMIVHFNYYAAEWGNAWWNSAHAANNGWVTTGMNQGWTPTHYAPHVTVMQMKSATASAALNQRGGRLDTDLEMSDRNQYFMYGATGKTDNESTGEGGYRPKVMYNAVNPTFGADHIVNQWIHPRTVDSKGKYTGLRGSGFAHASIPYYSQLFGLELPSSDGLLHRETKNNGGDNVVTSTTRQFAAFQVGGAMLNNMGFNSGHSDFWLRDMLGPNSSGVAMCPYVGRNDNGSGFAATKAITWSEAKSTYHVFVTIC